MNTRLTGGQFEKKAADYLAEQGYRILERNYRCRLGEIDLIALHQGYLVFIEVKYRSSSGCGVPGAAVNHTKQRKISQTAVWYMAEKRITEDMPCRFDVVGMTPLEIQLFQNAFEWMG